MQSVANEIKIKKSSRTKQLSGLFDLPEISILKKKIDLKRFEPPAEWNIGLIVGRSGSGKTSVLRRLYPDFLDENRWGGTSVIDDFNDELPIKKITDALSSVGFSSPPCWLKPYEILSNGEKFRCDIARKMLENNFFVVDEFTSVVDRQVAKACSVSVSKAVRRDNKKMIAASCHYDIVEWLCPDWVMNLDTNSFETVFLQRPRITLKLFEVTRNMWSLFKKYHYLSGELSTSAKCYAAFWGHDPVCFVAVTFFPHKIKKARKYKIHRLVVSPDYQGLGIGFAVISEIASLYRKERKRVAITSSLMSVYNSLIKNKEWRLTQKLSYSRKPGKSSSLSFGSFTKKTFTFEYVGGMRRHKKSIT